ncbi:hypothetical protein E4U55_007828, partial [Claviceps digitariae]
MNSTCGQGRGSCWWFPEFLGVFLATHGDQSVVSLAKKRFLPGPRRSDVIFDALVAAPLASQHDDGAYVRLEDEDEG